jgi:hypothetical protein
VLQHAGNIATNAQGNHDDPAGLRLPQDYLSLPPQQHMSLKSSSLRNLGELKHSRGQAFRSLGLAVEGPGKGYHFALVLITKPRASILPVDPATSESLRALTLHGCMVFFPS